MREPKLTEAEFMAASLFCTRMSEASLGAARMALVEGGTDEEAGKRFGHSRTWAYKARKNLLAKHKLLREAGYLMGWVK